SFSRTSVSSLASSWSVSCFSMSSSLDSGSAASLRRISTLASSGGSCGSGAGDSAISPRSRLPPPFGTVITIDRIARMTKIRLIAKGDHRRLTQGQVVGTPLELDHVADEPGGGPGHGREHGQGHGGPHGASQ